MCSGLARTQSHCIRYVLYALLYMRYWRAVVLALLAFLLPL